MEVAATTLRDVLIITHSRFRDTRGWFSEVWNADRMRDARLDLDFVQDNHSFSAAKGTLRGLHYQSPPRAQDKLVRCTRGAILDVAVDARLGSPDYGRWVAVELTSENGKQLLVPKGFLHGFVTMSANTEVQYKCTALYAPDCDGAVRWDSLGVDWRLSGEPALSPKDAAAAAFADWQSPFVWEGMI